MDLDEIEQLPKPDFRRANGAPMFTTREGKNMRASRPSGWGKELDDENALVNWKLNRAIEGIASDRALQARAVALKEDDRDGWKVIREDAINRGRGDQGSDIGTALHAMSERWEDPNDDFQPPPPFDDHLEAYGDELARLGLVSELFEFHVVNERFNAAGTADRLYRLTKALVTPPGEILPPGTLVLGDLKTGKSLDFSKPSYSIQLAIYVHGQLYDVENECFMPTPPWNKDWALLVHLPSDRPECELLWVSIADGLVGAELVEGVRKWRKSWRANDRVVTPVRVHDAVGDMSEAFPGTVEQTVPEADADWLALMTPWVQERLQQIKSHAAATQYLRVRWPEGVPTPKQGITEVAHMSKVLDLLDKTEAEFGLQFVTGRPATGSGHKRQMHISNTPSKEDES